MKKILYSFIITLFFTFNLSANTNNEELYKKIDLFAEVLDKIKKEKIIFLKSKRVDISSSNIRKNYLL